MAVHVRYNSWCISLPSSAKQQRELTKSYVFCGTSTVMANFLSSFGIERYHYLSMFSDQ